MRYKAIGYLQDSWTKQLHAWKVAYKINKTNMKTGIQNKQKKFHTEEQTNDEKSNTF